MAAPAELEQIIRAELRQPIEQLVRQVVVELVREQLNGAGPAAETPVSGPENAQEPTNGLDAVSSHSPAPVGVKTCRVCGETKPASAFERGRLQCRDCRRARVRERSSQPADDEEPHQPVGSQHGHKGARRLASDRDWTERRRQLIEQARVTTEEIGGRVFTVRHLPPQSEAVS